MTQEQFKKAELLFMEEEGYTPEKHMIFSPQLTQQAKHIQGYEMLCVELDEEDSVKYFGLAGYSVAAIKWAEKKGLLELDISYKSGEAIPKKPLNDIPLMTLEQAFEPALPASPPPPPSMPFVSITDKPISEYDIAIESEQEANNKVRFNTFAKRFDYITELGFRHNSEAQGYLKDGKHFIGFSDIEKFVAPAFLMDQRWIKFVENAMSTTWVKPLEVKVQESVLVIPKELQEIANASPNIIIASIPKANAELSHNPEPETVLHEGARIGELKKFGFTYRQNTDDFSNGAISLPYKSAMDCSDTEFQLNIIAFCSKQSKVEAETVAPEVVVVPEPVVEAEPIVETEPVIVVAPEPVVALELVTDISAPDKKTAKKKVKKATEESFEVKPEMDLYRTKAVKNMEFIDKIADALNKYSSYVHAIYLINGTIASDATDSEKLESIKNVLAHNKL